MEPNFMNFVENLRYMGVGMLGVFIIVGIIMAATYLTGFIVNKVTDKNKDETN